MAVGPLGLDLRTESEAQAAVVRLEVERERLGRVMSRCQVQKQKEYMRERYLMFDAAQQEIAKRFGLGMTLR